MSLDRLQVSVIVCTHNPRPAYLARTIDGLRRQTLSADKWELIIIDNGSDPQVRDCVDLSWHPRADIVREDVIGLTRARLAGIDKAHGDLLVFVDDDNVLDANYLEVAVGVAVEKPFLGSWSGQCRPEFEMQPPAWTQRYWGSLVIREFDTDVWSNLPRLAESMPCGAGLVIRREVAAQYRTLLKSGQRRRELDRRGEVLTSGGDNDLAACACDVGLGVGLIASLRLTHLIPPDRLTLEYLCRICEGIHYSGELLDHYRGSANARVSVSRRIAEWLRLAFLPPHDAAIARAVARGRRRARRELQDARR